MLLATKALHLTSMLRYPAYDEDASSMSDNDGEASKGGGTVATGKSSNHEYEEGRDEVKEIHKMSRRETQLIRTWRVILLVMLVITAAAVSSITYVLLRKEEHAAYKATVRFLSMCTHDSTTYGSTQHSRFTMTPS